MYPILVQTTWGTQEVVISAYAVCLSWATIAAWGGGYFTASRRQLPRAQVAMVLTIGLLVALCGARLWHAALHLAAYRENPALLGRLTWGSFGLHGLLLGGLLGGWLGCKWLKVQSAILADAVTLPIAAALVLIRLGCWLNGCCFGLPTALPCGVTFPVGSLPHAAQILATPGLPLEAPHRIHPTQLYEVGTVLLALTLSGLWTERGPKLRARSGERFLLFFGVYLLGLLFVFPLRGDLPLADIPLWSMQSMNVLLLGILAICWRLRGVGPNQHLVNVLGDCPID